MTHQKANQKTLETSKGNAGHKLPPKSLSTRTQAPRGARELEGSCTSAAPEYGFQAPRGARNPSGNQLDCIIQPWIPALIYLANDVERNPGPPKYPCGVCGKNVTWSKPAVACDICNIWYHKECLHMPSVIYTALTDPNASWTCCNCGIPNLSSSLFDITEISESNEELSSSNSSHNTSPGIPLHSSSPIDKGPKNSNRRIGHTKIMIINFQSIKNKTAEFAHLVDASDPDIIIGTETWLRPDIRNSEVFPATYKVYRRDRRDSYGGVLVAVKEDIISEGLNISNDIEAVFVKISVHGLKAPLIVGSLYRPPSSDIAYMDSLCEEISSQVNRYRSPIIWLGGDLNLPDIEWSSESVIGNRNPNNINYRFLEATKDCHLEQVVDFPTRQNAILDLFLTNRPTLVNRKLPLPGIGDHEIVLIDSSLKPARNKATSRKVNIWKRADIPSMITDAEQMNIDFHEKYTIESTVEEMWDYISTSLLKIMEDNVPTKMSSTRIHQSWITGDIKRLSRRKKKAFVKVRATRNPKDFERYQKLKNQTKKACRQAHATYLHNTISEDLSRIQRSFGDISRERTATIMAQPP